MSDPNWTNLPKATDYVTVEDVPSMLALERAIAVLDNWLDLLGPCPLHIDSDSDADGCTCREAAEIIAVRDWLKIQKLKD